MEDINSIIIVLVRDEDNQPQDAIPGFNLGFLILSLSITIIFVLLQHKKKNTHQKETRLE